MKSLSVAAALFVLLFALAGCGGSTAPAPDTTPPQLPETPSAEPDPPEFRFAEMLRRVNRCAAPRTGSGTDKFPYPDMQGTLNDELVFLRSWTEESYLWYDEVPFRDPREFNSATDYFAVLKTPALTSSGHPKDKYHFTYDSARWDALQRGASIGYGLTWARSSATVPRLWLATTVEPGSPAAMAGMRRGDQLLTVDGVDFEHATGAAAVAAINAGLSPLVLNETHRMTVRRGGAVIEFALVSATVNAIPVKDVKVFDTAAGKVGYLNFSSHNAPSERMLIDAVARFKAEGVHDLVLDMRYNGGGLLYIASELAYMIAGPQATANKAFERPVHNNKTNPQPEIAFLSTAYGFPAPQPAKAGTPLPTLNLKHVTVLATAGTCSASESVINSLRGVDVEVTIIGDQTCGKPYAFTPVQNCGITYFAIEFQGVNAKGFGDYADGFAADCRVADDLGRAQGDPAEGMLAAALKKQASGSCRAPQAGLRARTLSLLPVRDPAEEVAIAPRRQARALEILHK